MIAAPESNFQWKTSCSQSAQDMMASSPDSKESENGNNAIREVNERTFSDLLEAFFQDRDEDDEEEEGPDDAVPAESALIARGCEKLTSKIIRLETKRQSIAQQLDQHRSTPESLEGLLELMLAGYDERIRDCEVRLDRILEPNRRRFPICGVLADYYIG